MKQLPKSAKAPAIQPDRVYAPGEQDDMQPVETACPSSPAMRSQFMDLLEKALDSPEVIAAIEEYKRS